MYFSLHHNDEPEDLIDRLSTLLDSLGFTLLESDPPLTHEDHLSPTLSHFFIILPNDADSLDPEDD